jgi:TonB family protein
VFEKAAAAQTPRPPWLRSGGVSASVAAHVAGVLAIAALPARPDPPPRGVEAATYLMLLQVPRAPDRLFDVRADAEKAAAAAPQEPAGTPAGGGGEAGRSVTDLRLAPPGEAGAVPEIAAVPTSFDATSDLRSLTAAAGAISRGWPGTDLLAGGGPGDEVAFWADVLAEPPRMVNKGEITRLLGRLYPRRLRATGVQGNVMLAFIIGRDGRVEMRSVRVVATTHPDFTEPTLHALAMMRFRPARVSGEAVRVRASLPVQWVLSGALARAP